jgi:hypothetical protein
MSVWLRCVLMVSCVAIGSCALPDVGSPSEDTPATAFVRVRSMPAPEAAALVMDVCSPRMCRPVDSLSGVGQSRLLPTAFAKGGEVVLTGAIDDVRAMLELLERLESEGGVH